MWPRSRALPATVLSEMGSVTQSGITPLNSGRSGPGQKQEHSISSWGGWGPTSTGLWGALGLESRENSGRPLVLVQHPAGAGKFSHSVSTVIARSLSVSLFLVLLWGKAVWLTGPCRKTHYVLEVSTEWKLQVPRNILVLQDLKWAIVCESVWVVYFFFLFLLCLFGLVFIIYF